jgi:hypothetical protein
MMIDPINLEHPKVLAVEIDPHLEWDMHPTGGVHAQKEIGAWRTFVDKLETSGNQLPAHIEDPLDHYFDGRTGIFCRAKAQVNGKMVAGWAASRTAGRGLTVDVMWSQNPYEDEADKASVAAVHARVASGLSAIMQHQVCTVYQDYGT